MMPFSELIARVESHKNPRAFGDGGRALTSYQVHPAWLFEWAIKLRVSPQINDTWDEFVARVIDIFAVHAYSLGLTAVEAAMYFHLGHITFRTKSPDWDNDYAEKVDGELNA